MRSLGGFDASAGLAEDRCHLGSGIGRRQRNLGQPCPQRERLSESDRRSTADRDQTIDVARLYHLNGGFRHLDRRMHCRVGENSRESSAETCAEPRALLALLMRRQNECALDPETLGLVAETSDRSETEHHSVLQGVVDKCAERCRVRHPFRIGIRDAHGRSPVPYSRQSWT